LNTKYGVANSSRKKGQPKLAIVYVQLVYRVGSTEIDPPRMQGVTRRLCAASIP
jgi:hypothetical protein